MADVTIVTYEKYPDLAPDDKIFRSALQRAGASVRTAIWSDPSVDWSLSPVTVLRAVWDYPQRFAEFSAWIDRVERQTRLVNDAQTVRWNVHKRYLAELQAQGVAIVPTAYAARGEPLDLCDLCAARGWDDVVVKPCVGGSSYGAARFAGGAIAQAGNAHLRALTRAGDAMVQPYLHEIERAGELALIYIDGEFSHGVRKVPFNSSTVTTSERAHAPASAELAFAHRALQALERAPVYARVDVVPTAHGPVVMELELVEPTLYFEFEPRAAERLARAVARRES